MNAPHTPTLLERILNKIFDCRVIVNCDRDPYLLRWYVFRTERIGLFIHKFIRSDEDRSLHDHPWAFFVIPLWGGYIEHSDRPPHDSEARAAIMAWSKNPGADLDALDRSLNERIPVRRRVWPIVSARYRDVTYRHRVELIESRPSWSLFFRFTKVREWGFWPKEGFVLWNKWWQDKCE